MTERQGVASRQSGTVSKTKVLVAILAMCSIMMAYSAIMPILSEVQKSFPEASASSVQVVYSIAMLVSLPVMLASGVLTRWFSKKALTVFGSLLLALGFLPAFLHGSLIELYVGSALVGAGSGIVNIISSALISDYYDGVDKARVMGYQSAALSLMGAVLAFASGQIAVMWQWWWSFLLFLVGIPVAAVIAVCLPKDKPVPQDAETTKATYSKGVIIWAILAFAWSVFMYAFNTNIAMFIESAGFGGADVAGGVTTMFSLIGLPAGFVVGACVGALKRNVVPAACLLCAIGMVAIGLAPNIVVVYVGAFLFGLGFAIRNPCVVTFTAYIVPAAGVAAAIALVQAAGTVAGFISPFVVNFIASFFGGDLRATFVAVGVVLGAITVAYFLLNPVHNDDIEAAE